jgi:hypothetical protein
MAEEEIVATPEVVAEETVEATEGVVEETVAPEVKEEVVA